MRNNMDSLIEELRLIGCRENGEARCTCGIGQEAADYMGQMREYLLETSGRLHQIATDFSSLSPRDMRALANDMRRVANSEQNEGE